MKREFDGRVVLAIGLFVLFSGANTAIAYRNVSVLADRDGWVAHTYLVMDDLNGLMVAALDAETGQRGFAITGDTTFLAPFRRAEPLLEQRLRDISFQTIDNPRQQDRLPLLRHLLAIQMAQLRDEVVVRQRADQDTVIRLVTADRNKAVMDSVRAVVGAMALEESRLLRQRDIVAGRSRMVVFLTIVIGGLLELLAAVVLFVVLRRYLRSVVQSAALLFEQKERLRITLFSIGDAVATTDVEGRITFLNPVATQLTGWSDAEATGQPLESVLQFVNETTREPAANPALRALREGVIVGLANHTVLIARDGTERPIDDSGAPIRDAAGQVTGAVLVFRDITERHRTEQQLRSEDQRKTEFLAILAHELRNPLAPLRTSLEVLRLSGHDPAATAAASEMMERQLGQMIRLIDDLLDLSRITTDRLELRREMIDVSAVIQSGVETVGPLLRQAGHKLTVALPAASIHIHGDLARLTQAIANLLSNAVKYTPRPGPIALSAVVDNGEAVITIRDSGLGIPAEMLEQIFEMFTQVDRSVERTRGGLGIGLPLVKRIVELHGGSVRAESDGPGRGSTFIVRLPAVTETAPDRTLVAATVNPPVQARRILVVDDNRDAADSLALMLRIMGHETRTAYDGSEALAAGDEFRPDIALLDIGMPRIGGHEVARRIREHRWASRIVLVALTGWGQEEDRRRSAEAGFNHHLVKPVDLAALETVLNQPLPQ